MVPFLSLMGMGHKRFNKYIDDCFNKMDKSIRAFSSSHNIDDLLKLRTSIKKIRVCISCIEYDRGKKLKETRDQLRKYFRHGGKPRQLGLYIRWMQKHHFVLLIKGTGLDVEYTNKKEEFIKEAKRIGDELKKLKKQILHYAADIDDEKIKLFYTELIRTNLPLPFGNPPKKDWHAKRKNLKRIIYARKWQEGSALRLVSQRQADWMDRLQHAFGDWHDNEEMINWFRDRAKKLGDGHPKERLQKAIQKMEQVSASCSAKTERLMKQSGSILQPLQQRLEALKPKKIVSKKASKFLRAV